MAKWLPEGTPSSFAALNAGAMKMAHQYRHEVFIKFKELPQAVQCAVKTIRYNENERMPNKDHWEKVYTTKASDSVSWFQPHAEVSMRLIRASGISHGAAIIDVGGGASTLVDDLLDDGYANLTVLDLSAAALAESRRRLGARGSDVRWLEADITRKVFAPHSIDLWHDRAVFHFLTTREEREAYVKQVCCALKPGGYVIMATFGSNGPTQCSGLPVMRYAPDKLHAEFGEAFDMLAHEDQLHHTPFGTDQQFIYCLFRKQTTDDLASRDLVIDTRTDGLSSH